ncbi:MAG: metallophosphoesterase [Gemmatimonadaceae bacterium]|nr:metallophosphoesterase [Gemmatimonadaceae bacterium]
MPIKLQLLSDLHLNMRSAADKFAFIESLDPTGVDVLVLAGDIFGCRQTGAVLDYVQRFAAKYPQVVFVPGNHEYYGTTWAPVQEMLLEAASCYRNFHPLFNSAVVVKSHKIFGGTMWVPRPDAATRLRRYDVNDFNQIADFEPRVYDEHTKFLCAFKHQVSPGDIVVTHHLPSSKSIDPRYATSKLNAYFNAGVDKLIEEHKPALWMHGHTHSACDYKHTYTRVVCNPLGYPHEGVVGFTTQKIIEVT